MEDSENVDDGIDDLTTEDDPYEGEIPSQIKKSYSMAAMQLMPKSIYVYMLPFVCLYEIKL